jgi:hypothetical protein
VVAKFRTLLVWLLTLSMPLQGVAAASMAFCPAGHHAAVAAAAPVHGAAGHAHHASEADAAHHIAWTGAETPELAAQAAPETDDSHSCTLCSSCCSTGALVSSVPALPDTEATATPFASVAVNVDPFVADGPDRPPRPLLA